jgi:hypothetical protein
MLTMEICYKKYRKGRKNKHTFLKRISGECSFK